MKIMKAIHKSAFLLGALALAACNEEVDNAYSRHNFVVEINSSAQTVILDEDAADETALTVEWTPAAEYGDDYLVTYYYQIEVDGSKSEAITEYEDTGNFRREYTNAELQQMLVDHFGMLTSSYSDMRFTITVSFDGPTLIIPDEATVNVRVKTYGPKQFEADELYMNGSAFESPVKLTASETNPRLYVWTGSLRQGTVFFPVVYGDENNAIVPASGADTEIGETPMEAQVVDASESHGGWKIPADDEYRVTVNMDAETVTIIPTSSIVEIDKIYLAGTAVSGDEEVEVAQMLENASVYAFRGELKAGTLYLPLLYDEKTEMSFVPASGNDIHDGEASAYMQVTTSSAVSANRYWTIPADGIYRIVVDLTAKTITFRSAATDLKNTVVSFNKTYTDDGTPTANPYEMEVTQLWMYGTFNNYAKDTDKGYFTGFQEAYSLRQSLANPNVFVYKGQVLPRQSGKDDIGESHTGSVNFKVAPWHNNVFCYGSTAEAKRSEKTGYIEAVLGQSQELVAGQGDNRYAYFIIPEGCNYVEVDIAKMTVVFDVRE